MAGNRESKQNSRFSSREQNKKERYMEKRGEREKPS